MKTTPKLNEIVVLSHQPGATRYRVTAVEGLYIGVIDSGIEENHPEQCIQWIDRSLLMPPAIEQLQAER